jgi:catechol 2,3-dioxygenase-like lactoylglutathione lyase family enzyme
MADRGEPQPDERVASNAGRQPAVAGETSTGTASGLPYGLAIPTNSTVLEAEHTLELLAFDHVALRVTNIRQAEDFYHEFLEMDVVARARRSGDGWTILPDDFDWIEGLRSGYYPELVVLRNGPISLFLINVGRGTVMNEPRLAHLGLRVTTETLAALRGVVLIRSYPVIQDDIHAFRFRDPYGVTWHLTDTGTEQL